MSDVSIDNENSLYAIQLAPTVRNFLGQKTGRNLDDSEWKIAADSLDDFKHKLWIKSRSHFKREVVFTENLPVWSEKEEPEESDMEKFLSFIDGKGKRNYFLNSVSESDLVRWRDRVVPMNIYIYSTAVSSRNSWLAVEKSLIKPAEVDRAGAASINELNIMVAKLKEVHALHYRATDITWQQWANYILRQDSCNHARLIAQSPPTHLIHFFAHARTDSDELVAQIRQNLSIGDRVNSAIASDVSNLRSAFDHMKIIVMQSFDDFDKRLSAVENNIAVNRNLLDGFQEAVGVEENDFGLQEFENIANIEDVDHI